MAIWVRVFVQSVCVIVACQNCLMSAAHGAEKEKQKEEGFVSLFNGRNLDGWEGNLSLWKVQDGMIVGDSSGIQHNDFLATKQTYRDFELRLQFRLHKGEGNSGIQFRSQRIPNDPQVVGYQADIGQQYWGCLYDEHRRRKILAQAPEKLSKVLKKDGWNDYVIRAKGNRVTLSINGLQTVDYQEQDDDIPQTGIIALQVHSGPPLRVEFRNIRIKTLNRQ